MNTFKTYRDTMKLTQEELAELLEISPRQLQRIENKESNPSIKTFRKLIKVLKITDADILKIVKEELLED